MGRDICTAVKKALQTRTFPTSLNHTHVTLIPKKKSLEFVYDFRPISLCNILYKIVSEALTNRFKKILPQII